MKITIELDLRGARDLAAICSMFSENVETDAVPELDEEATEIELNLENEAHYKTARRVTDEIEAMLLEASQERS